MGDECPDDGQRWTAWLAGAAMVVLGVSVTATSASAGPVETEPLEIVAVDVTAFPRVAFDVALPEMELPADVDPGMFAVPGAVDVVAEALDPADLTLGLVLDDGPQVSLDAVAAEQGSATELVRNLPDGVEVVISTTSGVVVGPTADRAALLAAIGALRAQPVPEGANLGAVVVDAAARLETAPDPRRQMVVLTGEHMDIEPTDATLLIGSLDRSGASLRALGIGDEVGANLTSVAEQSGGVAAAIGHGFDAVLRAIDVLTTTFANQYRVTATMLAPGSQAVQFSVGGRTYETVVPDLGPAVPDRSTPEEVVVPTTAGTPSAPPSTARPPSTPAATSPSTAVASSTVPAVGAAPPASVPDAGTDTSRGISVLAGAEAIVAIAAIALVIAAVVRRRRQRVVPPRRPTAGRPKARSRR